MRTWLEAILVKSAVGDLVFLRVKVVDGGVSYRFNDGAEAVVEVREEDALQTVIFR